MTVIAWALERLTYWTIFALIVLSIERLGRNMNWNIFGVTARIEKAITSITLLGIAVLLIWAFFH
jgi:hypothetical protein